MLLSRNLGLIGLLVTAIVVAGCTDPGSGERPPGVPAPGTVPPTPPPPSTAATSLNITALNTGCTGTNVTLCFNATKATIKANATINVTFINGTPGNHSLCVKVGEATPTCAPAGAATDKNVSLPAGQTETVSFKAPASGTVTYYCNVGTHRARGLEGTLKVA